MSEATPEVAALRTAIDNLMGRAQELGMVQSVGEIGTRHLLTTGTLASRELSNGPLPVPRLVVTAPERRMKYEPFSIAILSDRSPIAPVLVAAEVATNAAISTVGPQDEASLLPRPHMRILTDSARVARPRHIDNLEAELLFQRIMNAQAEQP